MEPRPVSIVVMLKMFGGHYDFNRRRLDILRASLETFGPAWLTESMTLVVPDDEVAVARGLYDGKYRILSDSQVCPDLAQYGATNWMKQQFIKLSYAQISPTPFFMTLDPDNFATRPFTESDLIVDGKAAIDYTISSDRRYWWTASADVLQMDHARIPDKVMLVTPCVYSVAGIASLRSELETLYGEDWGKILLERFDRSDEHPGWIENAIYFLNLVKQGTLGDHHTVERPAGQHPLHSSSEVWIKEQFDDWDVEKCFSDRSKGIFSLVQGNTYIEPDAVIAKIGPYIGMDADGPAAG